MLQEIIRRVRNQAVSGSGRRLSGVTQMISKPARRRPNPLGKQAAAAAWLLLTAWLMLGNTSPASTITGTVMNLSRNKPSSGDDIVLYRVDKSMHEVSRAKADARGTFRFEGPEGSRYLVAAIHDKISYHTPLLSGSDPATVFVYDAVPRLAAVHESSTTLFPAPKGQALKIAQFFVVSNASSPARTLAAPFSFRIPTGAMLDSAAVEPPGTLPFLVKASACGTRDQYCVASPIRPGKTRLRVIYHFDFHKGVSIALPLPRSVNQVELRIPESLNMRANSRSMLFRNEEQRNGLSTYSLAGLHRGRTISFTLSPVKLETSEVTGEATETHPAFEARDADYETRSRPWKAGAPTNVSSVSGGSLLGLIFLLGAMSALFGAPVAIAMLYRPSLRPRAPEISLSRKTQ